MAELLSTIQMDDCIFTHLVMRNIDSRHCDTWRKSLLLLLTRINFVIISLIYLPPEVWRLYHRIAWDTLRLRQIPHLDLKSRASTKPSRLVIKEDSSTRRIRVATCIWKSAHWWKLLGLRTDLKLVRSECEPHEGTIKCGDTKLSRLLVFHSSPQVVQMDCCRIRDACYLHGTACHMNANASMEPVLLNVKEAWEWVRSIWPNELPNGCEYWTKYQLYLGRRQGRSVIPLNRSDWKR